VRRSARDDAGISLIHMAIAFVLHHPAGPSAIVGPERWGTSKASSAPPKSVAKAMCSRHEPLVYADN
jgi:hypothetical protein